MCGWLQQLVRLHSIKVIILQLLCNANWILSIKYQYFIKTQRWSTRKIYMWESSCVQIYVAAIQKCCVYAPVAFEFRTCTSFVVYFIVYWSFAWTFYKIIVYISHLSDKYQILFYFLVKRKCLQSLKCLEKCWFDLKV